MADERRCPDCGASLTSVAGPEGFCPECLILLGLSGSGEEPLDSVGTASDGEDRVPERIGSYRILRGLGEGGMGTVFLAEQVEPIRRTVALKLIKAGMDTRQVVTRFESERQALALMDHPNIARVYDAGATEQGRPYFVMEYVDGRPITEYCDRHRLTLRERLKLFNRVCEGVQHAHQRGIIHRDIKPTNVLVALQDDQAVPKIIDFGVARATEQELTAESMFTGMGQLIGTPEYMSPEQAQATTLDLDTRTDVYSLGVLLYSLLVGTLPLDLRQFRRAAFSELCRRIREDEPPKPSTRVPTSGNDALELARQRRTDPATLARELRGELDWITLKAMEKDRTRRYASPNELSADIRRHLRDEPVEAGPPSTTYRARKFIRRHRLSVAFGTLLAVVVLSFALLMTLQASRIALERDRADEQARTAEQVSEFLVDLFEVSDPREAVGEMVTARQVLDAGAEKIDRELVNQPRVRARLLHTMGRVYSNLGFYDDAEPLLKRAWEEHRSLSLHSDATTIRIMTDLAFLYMLDGRDDEAAALYREALVEARKALGPTHPDALRVIGSLANALEHQDRPGEAESLFVEALRHQRQTLGVANPDTQATMVNLANLYSNLGRYADAEPLLSESLDAQRHSLGEDHPDTLTTIGQLAHLYRERGLNEEAESLYLEVLRSRRRVLGESHPRTLGTMRDLAWLYVLWGRYDDASATNGSMLEMTRATLGPRHRLTLQAMSALANSYRMQQRYGDAESLFLETLEGQRETLGTSARDTRATMVNLALLYEVSGRLDRAESLLSEVVDLDRRSLGHDHPITLTSAAELAVLYGRQGRFEDAERLCLETLEARRRVLGDRHQRTLESVYHLARIRALQGRRVEALELLGEAVETGFTNFGNPASIVEDPVWREFWGDSEFEAIVAGLPRQPTGPAGP